MNLRSLLLSLVFVLAAHVCFAVDFAVGVYYFPGWKDGESHAPSKMPWSAIVPYKERKPLLGWYKEGDVDVMRQQLLWMQKYGVEFVAFDWYFAANHGPVLTHAIDAYRSIRFVDMPRFTLLWANHDKVPSGVGEWDKIVEYWCDSYFKDDRYLRVNSEPVVIVMSSELFRRQAETFGETGAGLLERAQRIASERGLKGIHFVAGVGSLAQQVEGKARADGYGSLSAYNFHNGPGGAPSISYDELDRGYRENWRRLVSSKTLPVALPVTAGWDRRPWGGSQDPMHDHSEGSVEQFRTHLQAAYAFAVANIDSLLKVDVPPRKPSAAILICCWNEYGEGSFVEPTESRQFSFLNEINSVFHSFKK